jgi:transcriptional regulator with XRE-family HTH domain
MATTGKELKLARVANDVTATALADRMGINRATLWHIEKSATVDPTRAEQYRKALATFENVATEGSAA